MIQHTRGIVLHHIKYKETSIIVRIFTEEMGLQSYLVHRVRTQKPQHNIMLFQPLNRLEMVVYHRPQASIHRLSEARSAQSDHAIRSIELRRATMAMFLSEVLTKSIREEVKNPELFAFLWESMDHLYHPTQSIDCFHLQFLLRLSHHLGFGIYKSQEVKYQLAGIGYEVIPEVCACLEHLMDGMASYQVAQQPSKSLRRACLNALTKYYQLHLDSMQTLKSLEVLQHMDL